MSATEPRRPRWLAAALVTAALLALWSGWRTPPTESVVAAPAPAFPWDRAPMSVDAPVAALAAPSAPDAPWPSATCPAQQLQLEQAAAASVDRRVACVSATRINQTGSVRSFSVQGVGASAWTLRVDMAGGAVSAIEALGPGAQAWSCHEASCRGVTLGRADRRGERSLDLSGVALAAAATALPARAAAGEPVTPTTLRVTARLTVPVDDQLEGLACNGPSVQLTAPDGARQKFCALGGAGIEFLDNGDLGVLFQNLEGDGLRVLLSGDGRVLGVEHGAYACRGAACVGVTANSADPADPLTERQFLFGHAQLLRRDGMRDVPAALRLDGQLILPAQP